MQFKNIELLAPAGSFESLMAAIQAGANAIYFGVEQLNMRSRSSVNFSIDDLCEISKICKEHEVKAYLTLNTIVYDHDISLMKSIVDAAKANNINAVIAADLAVMNYAKKIGLPVHISTQANITNIDTVEFYANYADVVVTSRELSLLQVKTLHKKIIRNNIKGPNGEIIKIEIFAHGALCMAVSGKCYLSLHSNFASANRGACIQNCRKSYIVTDKEDGVELEIDNEYIMSAKDLCTISFLDKILEAGVSVLKIEGRGRSADYVYTVTQCYRQAIDSMQNNEFTQEKVDIWLQKLATVYNRGFWDGYYLGKKMGEWSNQYGSQATKRKIYIGKGIKYFDKINVAEFFMEANNLSVGDEIIISGPTTGYIQTNINQIMFDNKEVKSVNKGDSFSIKIENKIRPSDKLYKLIDA
ncbi:MAG: peptidase U32 family protein [Ferruginibacter sp.]|nr:U32 family peptidase [Ferruginibacter sp.]